MRVKYYDLENKRVFITGGGSGIGASIVEHFCEQGSEVYFIDINEDESKKLIEDIKNKNHRLPTYNKCDLLNIKELQKTIADIISDKGPIDILINNAANDTRHNIDEVTEEYWNERINVNLRHLLAAQLNCLQNRAPRGSLVQSVQLKCLHKGASRGTRQQAELRG